MNWSGRSCMHVHIRLLKSISIICLSQKVHDGQFQWMIHSSVYCLRSGNLKTCYILNPTKRTKERENYIDASVTNVSVKHARIPLNTLFTQTIWQCTTHFDLAAGNVKTKMHYKKLFAFSDGCLFFQMFKIEVQKCIHFPHLDYDL